MARFHLAALALLLASPAAAQQAEPRTLTLPEALELLDRQSLTLAQARSRADDARSVIGQARTALMPTVAASGSYTRNNADARIAIGQLFTTLQTTLSQVTGRPIQFPTSGIPSETIIQPLESFYGSAGVRVPIFAGNAYWDLAAARRAAGAAEASVDVARLQLRAALQQAAWSSLAAEDVVKASERAIANAKDLADSAARALAAGTGAPLPKLQAETELVRRQNDLVVARANLDRSRLALGVLLGRAEPVRIDMPRLAPPENLDPEQLAQEAFSHRPELKAQTLALEAADQQVSSALWRVLPTLSASFAAFASTVPFPTGDKTGWRASADLSWALYDGGFRYAKQRQAEAQVALNRAALEQQRVDIQQQIQDATRDLGVARERLRLAERQQQLATEAAATARRSYEAGLASSLDVIDANDKVFLADISYASAKAGLGAALTALERATGRGL